MMDVMQLPPEGPGRPTDGNGNPCVGTKGAAYIASLIVEFQGWMSRCVAEGRMPTEAKLDTQGVLMDSVLQFTAMGQLLFEQARQEKLPE
jgi:hypothetical protein